MENGFQKNRYKVIKGLIDPKEFYNYITNLKKEGKLQSTIEAETNPGIPESLYKDAKFEKLLVDLKPVIEEHTGYSLYKTFSSARYFKKGDVTRARKNEKAAEICVAISLGHEESPWPISFFDEDMRPQSIALEPGDAIVFKGPDLLFWRSMNVYGDCAQLFLYYVNQNGPFAIYKDDHKPQVKQGGTLKRLGNYFGIK